jgi:glycosidase
MFRKHRETNFEYALWLIVLITSICFGQTDSVDVTFYYHPSGNPSAVYLPGEFNGWVIGSAVSAMIYNPIDGRWEKTVRLRVGGPSPLPNPGYSIPGAYQYKFNENGSSGGWLSDPLNPSQNPLDNNNSFLYINDPTIHYLLPNSVAGMAQTRFPEISAYLFPSLDISIDTSTIQIIIDEVIYQHIGSGYRSEDHSFSFTLPEPVSNGTHQLKLLVQNSEGSQSGDSTSFIVQAGFLQLLTQSNDRYLRSSKVIKGVVEDTSIHEAVIYHNDDSTAVSVLNGMFSESFDLIEGTNRFYALVTDVFSQREVSDTITVIYFVYHAPKPEIQIDRNNGEVVLSFITNDPDGDTATVHWTSDDLINPQSLMIDSNEPEVAFSIPDSVGEYYINLEVVDPDSNRGFARGVFYVGSSETVTIPTVNSSPQWVQDGIVYEIYLPALTPEGTFQAAKEKLPWIRSLGAGIIWLMPIYQNNETINEWNAGYNITDFYQVHPQLGTMVDFEDFVSEAHKLGLRVILDSTPNHVSENHLWLQNIRLYQDYSNFRPMAETRILGDHRGMGQYEKKIENYTWYVYYLDWTLANLNYSNIETVDYMMRMYTWWILEKEIDGYRMDVYWGPHNRYGKNTWWRLFREEIKRIRPDILIFGETDATGSGSENNFADGGGASDAANDWNLYGRIKETLNGGSINELDKRVRNYSPTIDYNHYTGPNSHYLRFLENHDEPRINYLYSRDQAKAGAVLLMAIPGIPMIYAGQEIGETSRRGLINWNRSNGPEFLNLYRRLCQIRNMFPTFRSSKIKRVTTDQSRVYSFLRPHLDQNAIVAINFSSNSVDVQLTIDPTSLILNTDSLLSDQIYYLNDVLNDTAFETNRETIQHLQFALTAWSSRVLLLADSVIHLPTGIQNLSNQTAPLLYQLCQNYPNPFNGSTTISYQIGGSGFHNTTIRIMNILGQEVYKLVDEKQLTGDHQVVWNGRDHSGRSVSTGIYLYQLKVDQFEQIRKIVYLK